MRTLCGVQSLVLGSAEGIKEHSMGLGAGEDLYTILASTLTLRSWDTLVGGATLEDRLAIPDTHHEKQKLQVPSAYLPGCTLCLPLSASLSAPLMSPWLYAP